MWLGKEKDEDEQEEVKELRKGARRRIIEGAEAEVAEDSEERRSKSLRILNRKWRWTGGEEQNS